MVSLFASPGLSSAINLSQNRGEEEEEERQPLPVTLPGLLWGNGVSSW